jgi:hypothetical protein
MVKVYHIGKFGEKFLGEMPYGQAIEEVVRASDEDTLAFWLGDGNILSGEFYPSDALNQLRRLAGDYEKSLVSAS